MDGSAPDDAVEPPEADEARLVGSDRVLAVLRELAGRPHGVRLEELARAVGSPKSTVHRALASLRRAGFASQDQRGTYVLGDEFLRLAFTHHELRPEHVRVRPAMEVLAAELAEAVHYSVLDGADVVYRAKVEPSVGAVRLTSTVGGRNPAATTAVGKLLLSTRLPDLDAVTAWVGAHPLTARTERSITGPRALHAALAAVRERGYATDDQENEPGINCLAVPVHLASPSTPSGGVSISAPAYRTPLAKLEERVALIREVLVSTLGAGACGPDADEAREVAR